jgi:hypothetical protein
MAERTDVSSVYNDAEWTLANFAFDLFTLAQRERAFEHFATLRYPSIRDRFFEAVHFVIAESEQQKDATC